MTTWLDSLTFGDKVDVGHLVGEITSMTSVSLLIDLCPSGIRIDRVPRGMLHKWKSNDIKNNKPYVDNFINKLNEWISRSSPLLSPLHTNTINYINYEDYKDGSYHKPVYGQVLKNGNHYVKPPLFHHLRTVSSFTNLIQIYYIVLLQHLNH